MKQEYGNENIKSLKEKVCELLRIVDKLESEFEGRKFSLDGHLLGSIGKVFAKYIYDIDLAKASNKLHDGEVDGRNVQIKITQIDSVDIKGVPDYLIVLFLKKDTQEIYEVYNGPGELALEGSKLNGNREYNKSLNVLIKKDSLVSEPERIPAKNNVKKWKKGMKN